MANNVDFWRAMVQDSSLVCSLGIFPDKAAQHLAVSERIGGRASYDREVREIVSVFTYESPTWRFTLTEAHPIGETTGVSEIDTLELIRSGRKGFAPQTVEKDVEYQLPDGRVIRGEIVRVVPHTKIDSGLHVPHEYVDIFYQATDTPNCGRELWYSGSLKPNLREPRLFQIRSEVRFDGELIDISERTYTPVFKKLRGDKVGSFARFEISVPRHELCLATGRTPVTVEQE